MKKYHFQENEKDFGSTVRLDAINDKVKEIKKKEETDELGDASEFLNVFESEKFDDPAETDENTEDALVDTLEDADALEDALGETRRDGVFPAPAEEEAEEDDWEDDDEEYEGEGRGIFALGESFGLNKKTVALVIVLAVLACGIGFSLVRCSFHPSKTIPLVEEEAGTPLLIQTDRGDGEYLAYDIAEQERKTVFLTEKTKMTDASGRKISKASLAEGDLLAAELDEDGKTLISVDYSSNAIRTEEATGLTVNRKKRTLTNKAENLSYSYEKESVFFYDGEEIDAADLAPCDELLLKLVGDTVWSVEVQAYHGYIVVENTDAVKNGKIQLDEAEAVPLTEGMQLAAAEGHHTVTVTGSNIETRKDAVVVEAGEETVYDLSKAQEKMGVIIINANVKDYKLYINGAVAESPAVLPMGEYDLVILKNGYTEWSQHVTLDKDTLNVTAELQKDVQYGTLTVTADVDGAWVYINGEEYGVAPMQVNLPYGSYNVMLEKSGYQSYKQSIQISSQTAAIHATME